MDDNEGLPYCDEAPEEFEMAPSHVRKTADLFNEYNLGLLPVSEWSTEDIVKLINLLDSELQNRSP